MCICPWMSLYTLAKDVPVIKASGNVYATDLITNTLVRLAAEGAALTEDFAWVLEVKPGLDSGAKGTRSLLVRAYRVTVPPLLP